MSTTDDGVIALEYGAREVLAGYRLYMWQPFCRINGRFWDLSGPRARDTREEAIAYAEAVAREDASRYVGDWTVTVREVAA